MSSGCCRGCWDSTATCPEQPTDVAQPQVAPLVVLIGPMGAGKSTVAELLGAAYGVEVRDTDADVELAEGRSISDIFVESGEATFRDMTAAIASALGMAAPQDWPLEQAIDEWGYEMASYGLGSNSRVRGTRARQLLGWRPHRPAVLDWIGADMLRAVHA